MLWNRIGLIVINDILALYYYKIIILSSINVSICTIKLLFCVHFDDAVKKCIIQGCIKFNVNFIQNTCSSFV